MKADNVPCNMKYIGIKKDTKLKCGFCPYRACVLGDMEKQMSHYLSVNNCYHDESRGFLC